MRHGLTHLLTYSCKA